VLGALAGVVVGCLIAGVVVASGALDDRVSAGPPADASEAFIASFQRSLEGTYVVEAIYTRELDRGGQLRSNVFVAQRPPDSIRRQFGGITGSIGGHEIMCSNDATGAFHCGPAAPSPDHALEVERDLENLHSYFAPPALYSAVSAGPDCFELTQLRPSAALPYGSFARFCFDPDTGAIRLQVQHLEGAVDSFEATLVRGDVSAADFDLGPNRTYDAQSDPTTTTVPSSTLDPGSTTTVPLVGGSTTTTVAGGSTTTTSGGIVGG
jgi:hypothetical protein